MCLVRERRREGIEQGARESDLLGRVEAQRRLVRRAHERRQDLCGRRGEERRKAHSCDAHRVAPSREPLRMADHGRAHALRPAECRVRRRCVDHALEMPACRELRKEYERSLLVLCRPIWEYRGCCVEEHRERERCESLPVRIERGEHAHRRPRTARWRARTRLENRGAPARHLLDAAERQRKAQQSSVCSRVDAPERALEPVKERWLDTVVDARAFACSDSRDEPRHDRVSRVRAKPLEEQLDNRHKLCCARVVRERSDHTLAEAHRAAREEQREQRGCARVQRVPDRCACMRPRCRDRALECGVLGDHRRRERLEVRYRRFSDQMRKRLGGKAARVPFCAAERLVAHAAIGKELAHHPPAFEHGARHAAREHRRDCAEHPRGRMECTLDKLRREALVAVRRVLVQQRRGAEERG